MKGKSSEKLIKDIEQGSSDEGDAAKGGCAKDNNAYMMWLAFAVSAIFAFGAIMFKDYWLGAASVFLAILTASTAVLVGSDPCFLKALVKTVGLFRKENSRLVESNDVLSKSMTDLGDVSRGMADVQKQLGSDAAAVEELLGGLERTATMQATSSAMSLFFSMDMDDDGKLTGDEAGMFLSSFQMLWDMLPDFPMERTDNIRKEGLDMNGLSQLLEALLSEDAASARKQLEKLCPPLPEESDSEEEKNVTRDLKFKVNNRDLGDFDVKNRDVDWDSEDEEEFGLKPWFAIGPLKVWGTIHLIALICFVGAVVLAICNLIRFDWFSLDLGAIACVVLLAGILAVVGELAVIAPALREESEKMSAENDELARNAEELREQVVKLTKMKKGFDQLQEQFGGNAVRAQKLLTRNQASTKAQAVSVLVRLFSQVDEDGNGDLEGKELDKFMESLEQIFKFLPSFDKKALRKRFEKDGFQVSEIKDLVDAIITLPPDDKPQTSEEAAAAAKASAVLEKKK